MAADEKFSSEQIEFFERNIRPLFVEHCHECHGAETQEAALRVDSRSLLLKGGETGPAVVPGDSSQGELYQALLYDPDAYQMPPEGKLPAEQIELVKKWIEMGAPWPVEEVKAQSSDESFNLTERAKHWSFQPLEKLTPPAVTDSNWSRNEVDNFILTKLVEQQLNPAEEADRRTWLRRAFLDVIGLPPTVEELHQFLADGSSEAYEKVVNQLLARSEFGERWGRHWLDVVRYAESRGHEFDYDVANAWQYRDYVIRAVNADVPFDQFVVEHIAGDLLTEQSSYQRRVNPETGGNESILGTGFWHLGEWVHSPVDIRQEEADRFDNMIDVYSKAFLGMTVACARCHDHKFDPIRQKDYYALQGFLQSSSYQQARFETMIQNESIAARMHVLREQSQDKLRKLLLNDSLLIQKEFQNYFVAATDCLHRDAFLTQEETFEDFESGTYAGWTVEGDAFGEIPQTQETIMKSQGDVGAQKKFFVNSHQKRNGGNGDRATGKMSSEEFKIHSNQIVLLVGGGNHVGKTCVNLVVDGKSVRSATGQNSNRMSEVVWEVADLSGKTARIEIIDAEEGGWGNIGVDQIVFVSQIIPKNVLQEIAQKNNLDPERLQEWVEHLDAMKRSGRAFPDVEKLVEKTRQDSEQVPTSQNFETEFVASELIMTGPAYHLVERENAPLEQLLERSPSIQNPYPQGDFVEWDHSWNSLSQPVTNQKEAGALNSWQREGRILRTPTFEIQSGKIHCLVYGPVNTYAAVASHILINGPLHKTLVRQHSSHSDWHWVTHDVSAYQGQNAHLEFLPNGDQGFAVQRVIQGELTDREKNLAAGDPGDYGQIFPAVYAALFNLDAEPRQLARQVIVDAYQREKQELLNLVKFSSATAPCLLEGTAQNEYVFIRGNWKKQGELVPRRFIEVFHGEETKSQGSGRLQLAEQMVDPQQTPILPRVIVNRIWHHYFGRGICPTPNDFGHLGQRPTHPELLDWLANELVAADWSQKTIHKKILLSATYRMSSQVGDDPQVAEVDPDNLLLHRMNVKRLEGEAIRDSILTVAGSLNKQMYGPSVPIHLTDFLEGRGRPGTSGPVDGQGRRSLYLSVRRNFPEPFFQAFDFPNPHSSVGRRNVSNVPAQALALMNNPMVVEQSRKWADRLVKTHPQKSLEQKVNSLFEQAYSRPVTAEEIELAQQFLTSQLEALNSTENDPHVWSDYCHVLLNSKEFIFVR